MNSIIEQLLHALEEASDHLEWCGYGDSYERECAVEARLPKLIADAISDGQEYLKENK